MKVVIQRVSKASVSIGENYFQEIGNGLVILLAIHKNDTRDVIPKFVEKIVNMRIFGDENQKMNLSLLDINGEILLISQFTLYGDCRKGNRPSFTDSSDAVHGKYLYELFVNEVKSKISDEKLKTGIFGEMMQVNLINDGPVTIIHEM